MPAFTEKASGVYYLEVPFGGCWTGIALIRGAHTYLIDSAGSPACIEEYLLPALGELGLGISDIEYLLCTHTHADHVGGHAYIKAIAPEIRIVSSIECADKLRDPLKYNILIRKTFPEHSPAPSAGLKGVEPDMIVGDGSIIGGEMQYISSPGHDSDSGCWLHLKSKTLFSGDSLQLNGTSVQGIALYMDLPSYRATLSRLGSLDIEQIIAGHEFLPDGAYSKGKDKVKEYLSSCLSYTELYGRIIEQNAKDGLDAPSIARALIKEVGAIEPAYLFLPLYSVSEHLKELKI